MYLILLANLEEINGYIAAMAIHNKETLLAILRLRFRYKDVFKP